MLNPQNKLYRWGPISACPLFMYFNIEPAFGPLKDLLGICYPESLVIFHDDKVTWVLGEKETADTSRKFADKYAFDKNGHKKYLKLWDERTGKLRNSFLSLRKINLSKLSKDKLVESYKKFSQIYYDWWLLTISLELATITLEPTLGAKLKSFYKDQKDYNHAFSALTSPLVLTFYRREQKDLLSILTLPKNKQEKALQNHQKKYYWIYNSYLAGKVLDLAYFRGEMQKLKKTDYRRTLQEIEEYPSHIKEEKDKIYKEIRADRKLIALVSSVEKFSALQDERKMDNFKAEHFLEEFVEAFAGKSGTDKSSLKLLVLNELADVFKQNFASSCKDRKISFVIHCTDQEITHYTGKNALLLANQFLNVSKITENIIQGTVASLGERHHFRGTARIILSIDKIGKLKDGEILVTTMTSPDFVIGMKKAGAIITDVGGMLSHAAIVSRELKKPCIVGTEIATKVIQDGDIVELHCGKGTVKITKHSFSS